MGQTWVSSRTEVKSKGGVLKVNGGLGSLLNGIRVSQGVLGPLETRAEVKNLDTCLCSAQKPKLNLPHDLCTFFRYLY